MNMITTKQCPSPETFGIDAHVKEALCARYCISFAGAQECPLKTLDDRRREMRPGATLGDEVARVLAYSAVEEAANA